MASKHRGESPLGSLTARRASAAALRWRRLRFEPLEERRLLATLTVNTLVDENNGIGVGGVSLREAVAAASPGDTVNFSVTGTISLTGAAGAGQIPVNKNLTIQGPGANLLTVKAFDPDPGGTNNGNGRRVFLVENFSLALDVTISGVTLTNGDPLLIDENDGGGAILNRENLTLNACVLTGNAAPNGGAIYSTAGTLTLNDCTISGNEGADGGAVLLSGGSLAVTRTTITNNQASNAGGGILSRSRPVTIVDSTISGNAADEGGGGIYEYGGSLSVTGSTISGNSSDTDHDGVGAGGGIFNTTGALSILNSTISGNSAGEKGAGIFSDTGQVISIKFSTLTGNVVASTSSGGGIYSANTTSLDHTIVAGNLRGASARDDVSGTFDARYSLVGDKRNANVNNNAGSSLIGTTGSPIDAKLGLLANNGGLTLTHALLSGSPALDAGDSGAVPNSGGVPQFDQRGTPFSRVAGARIDIGAVEMAATGPALPGDYNLNHAVDAADYVLWRKTNGTSVTPAYSGADGDGNSAVNSDDYTVWRSHFGNTSPGEGNAVQGLSGEATGSQSSVVSSGSADATSLAFAAMANMRSENSAPVTRARPDQSVSVDVARSADLLLVTGSEAGGKSGTSDTAAASHAIESATAHSIEDTVFAQLEANFASSLLGL